MFSPIKINNSQNVGFFGSVINLASLCMLTFIDHSPAPVPWLEVKEGEASCRLNMPQVFAVNSLQELVIYAHLCG